jgi:tetrahydromethanopterin S-methyltransferase subunit C
VQAVQDTLARVPTAHAAPSAPRALCAPSRNARCDRPTPVRAFGSGLGSETYGRVALGLGVIGAFAHLALRKTVPKAARLNWE